MGARRLTLAALVSLCALGGLMGFFSGTALALQGHAFLGSFGSFHYVTSVVTDNSTGDVYVLDVKDEEEPEQAVVYRYRANGEPDNFSSLGTNELPVYSFLRPEFNGSVDQVAVDNSNLPTKGDIYVTTPDGRNGSGPAVYIFAPDGSELGQLSAEHTVCGVAVDPNGHVYVESIRHGVDKYTPTSNPVKQEDFDASLTGGGLSTSLSCELAPDSQESLYVGQAREGPVQKFGAMQFSAPSSEQQGTQIAPKGRNFTVDTSTDTFYLDNGTSLVEYDSTGAVSGEFASPEFNDSTAVGANSATHELYVADRATKQVYRYTGIVTLPDVTLGAPSNLTETSATLNASVNPLGIETTCKVAYGTSTAYGSEVPCSPTSLGSGNAPLAVHADVAGLTHGTVYYYRFVLTNANGPETVVGEFVSGEKPALDGQQVLSVGTTSTTVQAQINPDRFNTTFHVEYGSDASYGSLTPVPDGAVGAGLGRRQVTWGLAELLPGTTYHFRMVATNAFGSAYGPDQVFSTFPVASTTEDACPNAEVRGTQQSSYLPDCRAYEMVSPSDKTGANVSTEPERTVSAVDGNAIKYVSLTALSLSEGDESRGGEYVAERASNGSGWVSHGITPKQGTAPNQILTSSQYVAFSKDLSSGVYYALVPLVPGHPNVERNNVNLYLRSDVLAEGPGTYELLTDSFQPLPPRSLTLNFGQYTPHFAAASADWKSILFESTDDLTPEAAKLAVGSPKAYEWHDGVERLAGVLPNGEAAEMSMPGQGAGSQGDGGLQSADPGLTEHAISSDGSRIVFTEPQTGNLYMRIDGANTVQVNVNERGTPEPSQPARFAGATADDSKVFFITSQALTEDAHQGESQVYMYEVEAPEGKRLVRIAPATAVMSVSPDAEYIYFVTSVRDKITGYADPTLGVWHSGVAHIIVSIDASGHFVSRAARVGADGKTLLFDARFGQAIDRKSTAEVEELYLYNVEADALVCVSCDRSGEAPTGDATFLGKADTAPTNYYVIESANRPLTADGKHVFFDTPDALVLADTNRKNDVYEYDVESEQLHLISSGTCDCDSWFVDASADGHDVFFTTRQPLVYGDVDTSADLYDARIEGGIPSQNRPPAVACSGEECQGPSPSPPVFSLPASASFSGPGNPAASELARPAVKTKKRPTQLRKRKRHSRHGKRSSAGRRVGSAVKGRK